MTRYSLHFGVNKVDQSRYDDMIPELAHAESDALYYHEMATRAGFTTAPPFVGSDATSLNLISGLEAIARQVTSTDLIMFTYSGHGSQVEDIDKDEESGWDQVLLLFDRPFIDDEFARLWALFPPRSRILMITDSCHNGTVSKFVELDAGKKNQPSGTNTSRIRGISPDGIRATFDSHLGFYKSIKIGPDPAISATVVHYAACADMEVCDDGGENDSNGLFTQKFILTYEEGKFTGTYQSFFDSLESNCPNFQRPFLDITVGEDHTGFLATEFLR
jgi:hypothetical protein